MWELKMDLDIVRRRCIQQQNIFCWKTKCRNYSYFISHHGVRFPWARLAICKHTSIVTIKCCFQNVWAQVLENLREMKSSLKKKKLFHFCTTQNKKFINKIHLLLWWKCGTVCINWVKGVVVWKHFPSVLQFLPSTS